jgi:hypothetical protein
MRLGRVFGVIAAMIGVYAFAAVGTTWAQYAMKGMVVWAVAWALFYAFVQRVSK